MSIFRVNKLQPFSTTNIEILSGITAVSFTGSFSGDGSQLSGIFPVTGSAGISGSLTVEGTVTVTELVETSAREYKDNIVSLDSQIENIQKLNPVTFTWKGKQEKNYGFIADEVEEIYPELLNETNSGIQYSKMVSILTQGLQDLLKKIEYLEKELETIKKDIYINK